MVKITILSQINTYMENVQGNHTKHQKMGLTDNYMHIEMLHAKQKRK